MPISLNKRLTKQDKITLTQDKIDIEDKITSIIKFNSNNHSNEHYTAFKNFNNKLAKSLQNGSSEEVSNLTQDYSQLKIGNTYLAEHIPLDDYCRLFENRGIIGRAFNIYNAHPETLKNIQRSWIFFSDMKRIEIHDKKGNGFKFVARKYCRTGLQLGHLFSKVESDIQNELNKISFNVSSITVENLKAAFEELDECVDSKGNVDPAKVPNIIKNVLIISASDIDISACDFPINSIALDKIHTYLNSSDLFYGTFVESNCLRKYILYPAHHNSNPEKLNKLTKQDIQHKLTKAIKTNPGETSILNQINHSLVEALNTKHVLEKKSTKSTLTEKQTQALADANMLYQSAKETYNSLRDTWGAVSDSIPFEEYCLLFQNRGIINKFFKLYSLHTETINGLHKTWEALDDMKPIRILADGFNFTARISPKLYNQKLIDNITRELSTVGDISHDSHEHAGKALKELQNCFVSPSEVDSNKLPSIIKNIMILATLAKTDELDFSLLRFNHFAINKIHEYLDNVFEGSFVEANWLTTFVEKNIPINHRLSRDRPISIQHEQSQIGNSKRIIHGEDGLTQIEDEHILYIGEVLVDSDGNTIPHGEGTKTWKDSSRTYTGSWLNGKKEGKGKETQPSSAGPEYESVYEGSWANNQKYGKGIYTDVIKKGEGQYQFIRYEGSHKSNHRHGKGGMHTMKEGANPNEITSVEQYEGEFKDGAYDGRGKYFYKDGSSYEGEWINGQKDGNGIEHNVKDGSTYKGEWKQNVKDGRGVLITSNSKRFEQTWKNGELRLETEIIGHQN